MAVEPVDRDLRVLAEVVVTIEAAAIALAALAALGLSGDPAHEPVHARGAGLR
jgi:hypothetical protein